MFMDEVNWPKKKSQSYNFVYINSINADKKDMDFIY